MCRRGLRDLQGEPEETMIVNGWLDWTKIMMGVADKVYSEPNRGLGLIGHSIVGTPEAAFGRFMSRERDADGQYTSYAAASVMFINPKVGPLIQMYPVTASTWTSGGREANTSLWAIETEGGAPGNESEPLNDNQVANLMRLVADFEAHRGFKIHRGSRGSSADNKLDNFREHGEIAHQLGYSATACPSRRYERFYEALNARGEDMAMTTEQLEEHDALVALFGGRKRLLDVTSPAKGMDYLLGYGREQAKLGVVIAATGTQAEAEAAADAYQKEYNA